MKPEVQGIGPALDALDRDQVRWTRNAARRLGANGFDARIALPDPQPADWYIGENLAFLPRDPAALKGAPPEELVATLNAYEETLRQVESAIGLAAEFDASAPLPRDVAVLHLASGGAAIGDLAILAPVDPAVPASAPTILPLRFVAARLPVAEAELLEASDMLILERGPWPMLGEGMEAGDPAGGTMGFDPATGRIARILAPDRGPHSHPHLADTGDTPFMTDPNETTGLKVPVALHLADIAVTQDELRTMAETGTFDLGSISEGLKAVLSVGGRTIGRGEIVRLGDRFAVLLDGAEDIAAGGAGSEPVAPGDPATPGVDDPARTSDE